MTETESHSTADPETDPKPTNNGHKSSDTRLEEADSPKPTKRLTLAQLADQYLRHLEAIKKSAGTLFSYSMDLKLALAELGEKTNVRTLTAKKVQAFFESERVTRTKTGLPKAEATIAKTRRVLRMALVWAADTDLIDKAPIPEPTQKK